MQRVHVSKWGNSLGIRIPRRIAERMGIKAGDSLDLIPIEEELLIRKAGSGGKHYKLSDILDCFCRSAHRPEEDFGNPQGEEEW